MMASRDIPWWVGAIYKVGVPTAIACYLVYILANRVQTGIEATNAALAAHIHQQQMHYQNEEKQLQLLRAICSNSAANGTERNECFK